MSQLILSIIGLVLTASLIMMGLSYFSFDWYINYEAKLRDIQVRGIMLNREMEVDSYKKMFRVYPDEVNFVSELDKISGSASIKNDRFKNSDGRVAFCYRFKVESQADLKALDKLTDKYVVNKECFKEVSFYSDVEINNIASITKWKV